MAEQRPYRVPGFSADARLARAKRLALLSLVGAFIAINWVTTQHAASVLRDASWLGHPLFHLRGGAVYAPWSWIVWWTRWYWAPQLEPLWRAVRSRGALPDGGRDGGLLRGYRDGAARLVRERLRPSRFRALGDDA